MALQWHLVEILIYIYKIISAIDPVFMLLLAINVSYFVTCLFMFFALFSTGLSVRALYLFKVKRKGKSISSLN